MSGHLLYTLYGFWFGPGRDPFRRDLITALNSSEEKGEVSNFTLTEGGQAALQDQEEVYPFQDLNARSSESDLAPELAR